MRKIQSNNSIKYTSKILVSLENIPYTIQVPGLNDRNNYFLDLTIVVSPKDKRPRLLKLFYVQSFYTFEKDS